MSHAERTSAACAKSLNPQAAAGIARESTLELAAMQELAISEIRTDGGTQQRAACVESTIAEYAALMREGSVFPPVTVWFDGQNYWLTDGFHRLAAASRISRSHITAQVRHGNLADAQWDSFGSNASHGLRRTREDIRLIVARALQHPRAAKVSHIEMARHIGIPETTVRRWRQRLSPPSGGDAVRLVKRGKCSYEIHTANIGRTGRRRRPKRSGELKAELAQMKSTASGTAKRLLNIVGNWALGSASPAECLTAIETVLRERPASPETPDT